MKPLALLFALTGLLAAPPGAAQCTTSWTNAAGGAWTDAASWSDGVPDAADDACIALAGTYAVTLDTDVDVRSLTLGGGVGAQTLTLGPNRTLSVGAPSRIASTGVLDWTGGTLLTPSGILVNDGLVRLTGGDQKRLGVDGPATLLNQGTFAWAAGSLRIGADAVVENHGLFDVQGDLFNATGGVLRNRSTGVLRKSAGSAFATLFTRVENEGLVESLSGLFQLGGGSTHTDARLEAAAGAEVQLYNATHTITGTLSGNPAGTVSFIQSSLVSPSGATLDFAGTGFEWGGGRIEGEGSITNAGLLRLTGQGQKTLEDAMTLTNAGTVAWEAGTLFLGNGGTIVNEGLFDVQSNSPLTRAGAAAFANTATGVYRKSGGAGLNVVEVPFENAGMLEAQSGTIYFTGGTTHTDATLAAAEGTAIVFGGSKHRIEGTLSGSPAGRVALPTGLGGVVEGGASGATLALGGSGFVWEGDTFAGSLTNAGLLRLTGLGGKTLADAATLVNAGTVVWEGGPLTLGSGAAVENAGLFDVRGDLLMQGSGAGGLFVNAHGGLFRKSGGTGTGLVFASVHFINEADGVISAERGTLIFASLNHQAGALVQGTAAFYTGILAPHGGDTAPGLPPATPIGTLAWQGNYAPSASSTLFAELSGTAHDRLSVEGTAVLDGTLHLDFPGLYAPRVGDAFEVVTASGSLSGTYATVEAPVGFAFDVAYHPSGVTVTVTEEPDVVVSAMAEHAPFVIPPEGGDLRFAVRLANTTDQAQAVDVWAEGVLPSGNVVPVRQRALTLPPEATVTRYFRLHVPGNAPAGVYTMRLFAGTHPDEVRSADAFPFEKAAPSGAAAEAPLAWRVAEAGEDAFALIAGGAPETAVGEALPEAYALHAAFPNPFATRATLRYALPEAGPVRVAVYDLLGREVAVLADGEAEAGRHEAVLDGQSLAAGVYVVRLTAGTRAFTQRVTLAR